MPRSLASNVDVQATLRALRYLRLKIPDAQYAAWVQLDQLSLDLGRRDLSPKLEEIYLRILDVDRDHAGALTADEQSRRRAMIAVALEDVRQDIERRLPDEPIEHGSAVAATDFSVGEDALYDTSPNRDGQNSYLLRCTNILKRFGSALRVGPVSLDLAYGQIVGVVGTNGSGKTTLLRMLAGELHIDEGTRVPRLRDAADRPCDVHTVFIPESPPQWAGRLRDYLSWQAALFGHNTRDDNAAHVEHALRQLDLTHFSDVKWSAMPDGMRMRSAIAAAIIVKPTLIVLDEPLGPLDPRSQQELLSWMRDYARGVRRTAFVISSHHLLEIESVADCILLLRGSQHPVLSLPKAASRELPAHRYYRVTFAPGTHREIIRNTLAKLRETGDLRAYSELATFFLLEMPAESTLGTVINHFAGSLRSVEDLTQSALLRLLWGPNEPTAP